MRDLSVYYCKKCGYYAYYQLPKNAVCPNCDCKMALMDMRYQDFMDLNYEERDRLISQLIINASASLVQRICAPAKVFNQREIIGHLTRDGKSIILITHKLKEIKASADYCTIIRQGKYIQTVNVAEVNEDQLAAMMVGRDVT